MPELREPFQLDAVTVVEQIIGPDAAAPIRQLCDLLIDSLLLTNFAGDSLFSDAWRTIFLSRSYEAVRFSTPPPQKNIRLRKSGSVEEAVPAQACEFIEYRLSESLRRIPGLRSRCPIDE